MITYALFFIILATSLILYLIDVKKFFLSIMIFYPIAAQMVSKSISIFGLDINFSMFYGIIIILACIVEVMKIILAPADMKQVDVFLFLSMILFLIFCLISLPLSVNKYHVITAITKTFTWLLLILVSMNLFKEKQDLITISYVAMGGALIIILSFFLSKLGLYGNFNSVYEETYDIVVASGEFYNQVSIVYPLVIIIPLLMINLYLDIKKKLVIFVITLSLVVSLSTFARAPIVSLTFSYLVFLFYLARYRVKEISTNLIFAILIITIALTGFVLLHSEKAFTRWTEPGKQIETGDIEHLGSGRAMFLVNALNYYLGKQGLVNQVLGNGIGTSYIVNNNEKIVHNGFLEILIGCGLLGLIVYLCLLVRIHSLLIRIISSAEEKELKLLACLGIMGFAMVLCAHMDIILFAVFPMTYFAIHIGASIGVGWKQIYE